VTTQSLPTPARIPGPAKAALAIVGSFAVHLVLIAILSHEAEKKREIPPPLRVSVVEVQKPKPPPPPPEPPKPEPPKPPPPKKITRVKPPLVPPPPVPVPPPAAPPPPSVEAKHDTTPVVLPGVTMESTTASGGFAVNTGNTLYGDPGTKGRDPASVKPYKAERYVAAARVSELPRVLNSDAVDIRKYYPDEAKKKEFEGDVVLKLLIDSDGSIAKVTVVSDPGEGLGAAAMKAVREFRFAPGTVDGAAVATTVPFTIHFTIVN
jgi:protein TonB